MCVYVCVRVLFCTCMCVCAVLFVSVTRGVTRSSHVSVTRSSHEPGLRGKWAMQSLCACSASRATLPREPYSFK
mgnify:CR=1 FL=1